MKNVIKATKKSILLVTVFVSMLSNANEINSLYSKDDIKNTALTITDLKEGNLLTIKDYYGEVLYKELIKVSGTYRKGFNLKSLPEGDYFFEVEKDFEIKTIPFIIKSNVVVILKANETSSYKPSIRQRDNLVFISKLSPSLENVKISVYSIGNNGSELLYSENIEGVQTVERVYKLEKGDYKIVFNSNNQEFTKFINN